MKPICLLACVLAACSGTDPLVGPGPHDAAAPGDRDAAPSEKPSFAVTAPLDGALLTEAGVEVRGTAENLDSITVAGRPAAIAADGTFAAWVELEGEGPHRIAVAAYDAGEVELDVIVDLSPPELEILSPPRGAFLAATSTLLHVEGRASDAVSGIVSVQINGRDVALSGDRFSIDLELERGVNVIEAVAIDGAARSADVLQGAVWGEYAPWDALLTDAVSIGLRADAFEVFEAQLEVGLSAGLSTAALAQQDPSFVIDAIRFASIDVELTPEVGLLEVAVVIDQLAIDFTLDTVVLGFPVQTTGVITADRVEMGTEIHVGPGPRAGALDAHTEGTTGAIVGFAITAVDIPAWITDILAGIIEPQLESGFVQALDQQDLSTIFDLSPFLPEGSLAEITSVAITPEGMTILADAAIQLPPDPAAPDAPGVLIAANASPPGIPTMHMARTSLSDDLINGVLFQSWRSGALTASIAPEQVPGEIALDAGTFALFFGDSLFDYADPTTRVAIRLRPLLPPVAELVDGAAPTLKLTAADALFDFSLEPEGEAPIRFATVAALLETATTVRVVDGALVTDTFSSVRVDLADTPLFPVQEELLEELISGLILGAQLANPLLGIPLQTGTLRNASIEVDGEYLSLAGDL